MDKLLLTIDEVAAALGVGRRTAYGLRADDPRFPRPVPLASRVVKYRVADVIAYVEALAAADPVPEPAQLKAGRAASRGHGGGLANPGAAKARPARVLEEPRSIEP